MAQKEAPATVPLYSFIYLFNGIANSLKRNHPGGPAWEQRLSTLGQRVGRCTLPQAVQQIPPEKGEQTATVDRPTTPEEAAKFVGKVMFKYWFGAKLDDKFIFHVEDCWVIQDDSPMICSLRPEFPNHKNLNVCAYVAGMIKGVLDAYGFPCTVLAAYVHDGDDEKSQLSTATQYQINFAPVVDRRRRFQQ